MLLEKIKKDRMEALRNKESLRKDLLGVLIGEVTKETKEPSDTVVVATIKKFIANSNIIIEKSANNVHFTESADLAKNEIAILEAYLPKQLSEEGLKTAISFAIEFDGAKDLGGVMKYLKANHLHRFDSKDAIRLINEILKS